MEEKLEAHEMGRPRSVTGNVQQTRKQENKCRQIKEFNHQDKMDPTSIKK